MAVGLKLPILQIVGFQNSGKTTLTEKLVRELSNNQYKVGTIKHHGHGGAPKLGDEGKDTAIHRQAGAAVVTVEGNGTIQLTSQQQNWDLNKTISLYESFLLDIIVIEGYKKEPYPKVVLIRKKEDLELLNKVSNILCVVSQIPLSTKESYSFPWFLRSDEESYLSFLLQKVRG
ncbi:molybdopterin-guanine dinucleotide biosynthesis protein B [Bacillus sp. AK128]